MTTQPLSSRTFWPLFLILAILLVSTRSHHFATYTHLPDASWAVFFLAGFYLRHLPVLAALLALAAGSDYVAIRYFAVSDFCVSPAYVWLIPAYTALWLGGHAYARHYRFDVGASGTLAGFALLSAAVSELLSSGGFYAFSGRFTDLSFSEFADRLLQYFPQSLSGLALYLVIAVITHIVFTLGRNSVIAHTRTY